MQTASIRCEPEFALRIEIIEAEDLGIWIRAFREGEEHHFLLRWEYILGIDVQAPRDRRLGLSGGKGLG